MHQGKNDPVLYGIVVGVVLIVIAACLFLLIRETLRDYSYGRAYEDWQDSVVTACRSFEPPQTGNTQPIDGTIWELYTGNENNVMAKVPGSTPEEWDRAGRYVAIIDEMVEPTGYEYVDKKSGYRLGITAVIFTWKVTVCDIQEQRRIAENTFRGDPPPQELPDFHSTPNGIYGIQPARQMDAWLASLKAQ